MSKRNVGLMFLVLLVGAMVGSILGVLLGYLLPDGVVRDFFLTSIHFDLGGLVGQESGVITLDLIILTVKVGLNITLNFTSLIGLAAAYYFLRYFR